MWGTSGDCPAHDSAHISPFYLSMQTYAYKYYFSIYMWIPFCFFLLVFTCIWKPWHPKWGVMWCERAGDDIKPESRLVARDKHLQKGPWGSRDGETWACMLTLRRNLRVLPQVRTAAREQDSWNLCGSDNVLFQFQEETSYTTAAYVRVFQKFVCLLHNSAQLDRAGESPKILSALRFCGNQ